MEKAATYMQAVRAIRIPQAVCQPAKPIIARAKKITVTHTGKSTRQEFICATAMTNVKPPNRTQPWRWASAVAVIKWLTFQQCSP